MHVYTSGVTSKFAPRPCKKVIRAPPLSLPQRTVTTTPTSHNTHLDSSKAGYNGMYYAILHIRLIYSHVKVNHIGVGL